MFKPIVARFLQHITNQNNWSRKHLLPYSGKVIQFDIALIKSNLLILEDGSLGMAADNATADSTVSISPSLALRLLAKDEAAKMQISIEGDAELAAEVGKVLQLMRWDFEDDLSYIVGDIPAHKMVSTGKTALNYAKKQSVNVAEMLTEYWQEEKPILAKKWQVEAFNDDIDTLRSDYARLEKRIEKLTKKIKESTTI